MKNGMALPVAVMAQPIRAVKINGPNAAHAPVQPSICAPLAGEYANTIGYWRKGAALFVPVIRNMKSITHTTPGNFAVHVASVGVRNPPNIRTIQAKFPGFVWVM